MSAATGPATPLRKITLRPGIFMPPVSSPIFCSLSALRFADRVVERDDEQVFERLDVVRIDASGLIVSFVTRNSPLTAHGDHAARGRALDGRVRELFLHARHLLLHLAQLLHHLGLIHVRRPFSLAVGVHSSRSNA